MGLRASAERLLRSMWGGEYTHITNEFITGGGGEANTASNAGVGGVGVFDQKDGVDLKFRNINAGSSKVTITNDAGNSEIDVDVDPSNINTSELNNDAGFLAGLSSSDLNELQDVVISAVGDNEVLAYDSGGNWINQTASEAGLAEAVHTHTASDVTDFDTEVSNNTDVSANTTHRSSDGSDHTYIDQSVVSGASPTFDGANFTGVDADDVDIADAGALITATDVEGALAENRGLINTNTTHSSGDGSDHADVATNTTHSSGDGSDHADVASNTTHRTSNGSDHTFIDQSVVSGASPTFDGANFTGVDANDVDIADAGGIITATDVEGALQENRTAIDLNTAKDTNATHTGEVTGSGALTIADNVVDEANLKVNAPTNDYVLTADDTEAGGMKWAEAGGGTESPLTTKGDLYTYDSDNQRLAVGTDGQVLTADSGEATGLKWAAAAGGGVIVQVDLQTTDSSVSSSTYNTYEYWFQLEFTPEQAGNTIYVIGTANGLDGGSTNTGRVEAKLVYNETSGGTTGTSLGFVQPASNGTSTTGQDGGVVIGSFTAPNTNTQYIKFLKKKHDSSATYYVSRFGQRSSILAVEVGS